MDATVLAKVPEPVKTACRHRLPIHHRHRPTTAKTDGFRRHPSLRDRRKALDATRALIPAAIRGAVRDALPAAGCAVHSEPSSRDATRPIRGLNPLDALAGAALANRHHGGHRNGPSDRRMILRANDPRLPAAADFRSGGDRNRTAQNYWGRCRIVRGGDPRYRRWYCRRGRERATLRGH
jgi:hypothetical protein